jgi:hypothetical protein
MASNQNGTVYIESVVSKEYKIYAIVKREKDG